MRIHDPRKAFTQTKHKAGNRWRKFNKRGAKTHKSKLKK